MSACFPYLSVRSIVLHKQFLHLIAFSLIVAAGLLLSVHNADAEFRQAPNSRVALDLGAEFQPSDRFSGFADKATGASFIVVEFPLAAYDELKGLPNHADQLAKQGLSKAETRKLGGRSGSYVYFSGTQKSAAGPVEKFVLIFRENRITVMIIANIPQKLMADGRYSTKTIDRIFATATVKDRAAPRQALFRLNYTGPFKPGIDLMGTARTYSLSGEPPRPGENRLIKEPMLMVAPSLDERTVRPSAIADRAFRGFIGENAEGDNVESQGAVTIGGLKGYRIIGEAREKNSREALAIAVVTLADEPGGYYMIIATMPASQREKYWPEIEKVIASFERVKAQ